jgi:hypothetical protein
LYNDHRGKNKFKSRFINAEFMGPGSKTIDRIIEKPNNYYNKDNFISNADLISMMHDIRYDKAKNESDIKFADSKML